MICTDLSLGRRQIFRHLKHRWWVEVISRTLKEGFGLGDLRCRGERSLERWVELVLLAYTLAGLTRPAGASGFKVRVRAGERSDTSGDGA